MTVTLVFLAVMMAIFGGWLFSHSINVRPWEAQSSEASLRGAGDSGQLPPAVTAPRVGLAVFLAVVTSLFALTISAYLMRMEMGQDWRPLPPPTLLWLNSLCLVLGSIALQWAWNAARAGNDRGLRRGLELGGVFTVAFVLGQGLVWRQLNAAGFYMVANPATAFFFLMTALHALHLLGGLFAWAATLFRVRRGAEPSVALASVELCAVYWHFLLVIWFILFALVLST